MNRYVILTKSGMKKTINGKLFSGVCVVAYSIDENRLVRFVQKPYGSPLYGEYVQRFNPMDEVEVEDYTPFIEGPQTENLLISVNGIRKVKHSSLTINDIAQRVHVNPENSYMNDSRFYLDSVSEYKHSIEIIRVSNLNFYKPHKASQPRATFLMNNKIYKHYRVTAPAEKQEFSSMPKLTYLYEDAYLIISIPSIPFEKDGKYYKFIAAVYPIGRLPNQNHDDELPF